MKTSALLCDPEALEGRERQSKILLLDFFVLYDTELLSSAQCCCNSTAGRHKKWRRTVQSHPAKKKQRERRKFLFFLFVRGEHTHNGCRQYKMAARRCCITQQQRSRLDFWNISKLAFFSSLSLCISHYLFLLKFLVYLPGSLEMLIK